MILFLIQRYITFRFNHLLSYFATLYSRFSTEIVGTLRSGRFFFALYVNIWACTCFQYTNPIVLITVYLMQ